MSYTSGEYSLGGKYMFYVKGQKPTLGFIVPDSIVPEAQSFFTKAYAVRITTIEDLDALHKSATDYLARPEKDDISQAAISRAVQVATTYTPYNNVLGSWTPDKFTAIPYVSAAPSVTYGQSAGSGLGGTIGHPTADNIDTMTPANDQPPAAGTSSGTSSSTSTTSYTSSQNIGQPASALPWYKKYKWPLIIAGAAIGGLILWKIMRKK